MPLDAYSPPTYRVRDGRASRVVLEQNSTSQADENGIQVSGTREVHQEGEHDHAQHWGFSSRPAQGTELVEILDQYGSRVAVAERIPCPVSLADGESCLWRSGSAYVVLKADESLEIKSAGATVTISSVGAVAVTAAAGKGLTLATSGAGSIAGNSGTNASLKAGAAGKVTLGRGGAAAGVARLGDAVTGGASFLTWMGLIQTVCQSGVFNPGILAPGDFGVISAASSTTEAD